MNNQFLLSLLSNLIPLLAIGFVGVLLIYKIYIKIRSKFNTTVNCWFCNQNARVPYLQSNSWTCPSCEQYNGFTKDGDYNREIFEQLDCSNLSGGHLPIGTTEYSDNSSEYARRIASLPAPRNGFCDGCNEAQRLKVEKLAQFEPKNESRFEEELKVYKAQLEEQYRLCSTCDRHLCKVLREKKKMVLGSKFLDFIIKGAETLKQPHFNQIRFARQNHWKQRCSLWISILTALNIACLLRGLPALRRETFTSVVGDTLGSQLFILCSHALALSKVLASYFEGVWTHPTAEKLALFIRTIFMMLLYSMGLRWPPSVGARLSSVYLLACPFVLLSLAFVYNVMDGFKLTRYTFLLAVWSTFAGGLVGEKLILSAQVIQLLASLATLLLTVTSKNVLATSRLPDDESNSSFHKIYSEDYLSDEDTLSILSQHLNSSAASMRSLGSNSSYRRRRLSNSPTQRMSSHGVGSNARLVRSPLTSSAFSLNNFPSSGHAQISPNSSFQQNFNVDDNCHNQSVRSEYAASMCNFPTVAGGGGGGTSLPRSSLFASNLELSSRCKTPLMPFGFNGSTCGTSNGNLNHSASFLQPLAYPPYHAQRKSDESFFTTLNGGGGGGGGGIQQQQQTNHDMFSGRIVPQRPLASPFSMSNNAVYEPAQRANNLLTPSRFSTTCLASNASASSWLSGGYFNQRQPANQSSVLDAKRTQNLYGHRNGMTVIDENLSRASSQSSGFESQNERPVNHSSRENSFCPDAPELLQRTMTAAVDTGRGFQPIEPNNGILFSPRPSLLSASQTNLARPLSINCSSSSAAAGIDTADYAASNLWLGSSSVRGRNGLVGGGGALDSFNLRKINEDLPTIRRGDLLRKWKEGQALS